MPIGASVSGSSPRARGLVNRAGVRSVHEKLKPCTETVASPPRSARLSRRRSKLSHVWVWGGRIHPTKGIHVGSSKLELLAAYPFFASTVPSVVSDGYLLSGTTGSTLFEVSKKSSDDGSNYWPNDEVYKVLWMGGALRSASLGPIAAGVGGPSTFPQYAPY